MYLSYRVKELTPSSAPAYVNATVSYLSEVNIELNNWCRHKWAITWANIDPDLFRHMASPGHSKLKFQSWS